MRRVQASAILAAPPAEVFAFIAELDNLASWQSGIVSATRTSTGPMGVDATALVVRELMGQRIEAPLSVTAFEPPHRLGLATEVSGVRAMATLDLAPQADGTSVTFTIEVRASGLTAFMEPVIASAAAGDLDASLARLKERFARPASGEEAADNR